VSGRDSLTSLDRARPQRSAEQRVTQAPITFSLGGETVQLRVLTINESRTWKQYASAKIGELAASKLDGDALVTLLTRMLRDGVDEQIDLVLRYDVDGTIPATRVDDERGLLTSSWIDERATEYEVEEAFLAVVTVGLPFVRRARSLLAGQDWTALLKSLRELQSPAGKPTTPRSPSSTS
jgi:hypothetical protein